MIKDKYKNLKDEEFVPLDCFEYLDKRFKGAYEINKLGHIRTVNSGNIRKDITNLDGLYPVISLNVPNYRTTYPIHKLVALTFLEQEEGKPIIDHIDRNIDNYKLSNLRYVSVSESQSNRVVEPNKYVLSKYGKDHILIERKVITPLDCSTSEFRNFHDSQRLHKTYKGYYWVIEAKELVDYSKKYPMPLKQEDWKPLLRLPGYKISRNGYVIDKKGVIRIGYRGSFGYRRIELQGTSYRIHRLVYETFVANRLLEVDEYIDHINTITDDNDYSNLRVVNQSENMNNYNTRIKSTKGEIQQYDINGNLIGTYENSIKLEEELSINRRKLLKHINGSSLTFNGFIWAYSSDTSKINLKVEALQKLNAKINQYDLNGNLVGSHKSDLTDIPSDFKRSGLKDACKLLIKYKGYYWCYEYDKERLINNINKSKL
jgi:hypothetical protein